MVYRDARRESIACSISNQLRLRHYTRSLISEDAAIEGNNSERVALTTRGLGGFNKHCIAVLHHISRDDQRRTWALFGTCRGSAVIRHAPLAISRLDVKVAGLRTSAHFRFTL